MSDKMECPGCGSYTSTIRRRFEDGLPCDLCGLPAEAAMAVLAAQVRGADQTLIERAAAAEKRAAELERENGHLRSQLADIRRVLERPQPTLKDMW